MLHLPIFSFLLWAYTMFLVSTCLCVDWFLVCHQEGLGQRGNSWWWCSPAWHDRAGSGGAAAGLVVSSDVVGSASSWLRLPPRLSLPCRNCGGEDVWPWPHPSPVSSLGSILCLLHSVWFHGHAAVVILFSAFIIARIKFVGSVHIAMHV